MNVTDFYATQAATYHEHYGDDPAVYPANRLRLEILIPRLKALRIRSILEAGCGEGSPLAWLSREGFQVCGFDATRAMLDIARQRKELAGRVWYGDMEDAQSWAIVSLPVDAVLLLGPLQHVAEDFPTLAYAAQALKPGGRLFVECRNVLFGLYTFNRPTAALLESLMPEGPLREKALHQLCHDRLAMGLPPPSPFESTSPRWHNPLTFPAQLAQAGLTHVQTSWFHWHAVPPQYESLDPAAFRAASLALEKDPLDWRGMFLCSAFIAEAVKA